MTNDESLAKLSETEKELAKTKKELELTRSAFDSLVKEHLESQRVTIAIMTMLPEINEKVKALTPEQIEERIATIRKRMVEKTQEMMRHLKKGNPGQGPLNASS